MTWDIKDLDRWVVLQGDCLERLKELPDNSVDSIVTDPPAAVGFMNRKWDTFDDRKDFISFMTNVMIECKRVLKPGGHALVWALPRTAHWTSTAIEDAGFEIRDVIAHMFGSGFPKSRNISKDLDKAAGAEREVVGEDPVRAARLVNQMGDYTTETGWSAGSRSAEITAPATDLAKQYDGWGTALKPGREDWILARKPLNTTIAKNVLEFGTGGLNIDGCRVNGNVSEMVGRSGASTPNTVYGAGMGIDETWKPAPGGRWPANIIFSHDPGCELVGTRKESVRIAGDETGDVREDGWGFKSPTVSHTDVSTDVYRCTEGCPVAELDRQSGKSKSVKGKPRKSQAPGDGYGMTHTGAEYDDVGGASRFFTMFKYQAKPSRKEKDAGLEHLPAKTGGEATDRKDGSAGVDNPRAGAGRTGGARNPHPTVKGAELMSWLCRLVTPSGGIVLDPFAGSGSTGVAAMREGFRFIGCEKTPEYLPIIEGRLRHALDAAIPGTTLIPDEKLLEDVSDGTPLDGDGDEEFSGSTAI